MNRIILLIISLLTGSLIIAQDKDWEVTANDIKPPGYAPVTVANGITGYVSAPDPFQWKRVMMSGVYDVHGNDRVSHLLEVFNPLGIEFIVDGETITKNEQVTNYKQVLNMKTACLTTSFVYKNKATVSYTLYSLRQLPYVSLLDIEVKASQPVHLEVKSGIHAPDVLHAIKHYKYEVKPSHGAPIKIITATAQSPTEAFLVGASNSFILDDETASALHYQEGDRQLKFGKTMIAGDTFSFSLLGAVVSSRQNTDPLNQTQRMIAFARLEGKDKLIARHIREWAELWKSDIELEGDDNMQQEIRKMIYHLYSFARAGTANSIPPMGLSNFWYSGHIFWDAELWMFPPLLLLQPGMARSMMEYRFQRLEAARLNAQTNGYKGAMFPWESAESGFEETPVFALTGPFEHHITADIGIAAWNYYCVTKDINWLRERGYPLLKETADFWLSRVEKNGDSYDINNVVAADEWAENVDNNAFTNAAAKANLRYAWEAGRLLKAQPDKKWLEVAEKIKIETFPDGVVREHKTYNGEKIKQADVNLLSYPLKEITANHAAKINLEYYKPRVGDGPAMTHSIFSVIYSRIGDPENALASFQEGLRPNLLPPFGVIAETAGGTNPYFATGAGGFLQAILNGFGGLDITSKGIVQLKTKLPGKWKSLKLKGIGPDKRDFYVSGLLYHAAFKLPASP